MHIETKRMIIDPLREDDREDYFRNISHDRKVLETFICRYAEKIEDLDFTAYLSNHDLSAIRLKETGKLIGIILFFDETKDSCEIGYGIGSDHWGRGYGSEAVRAYIDWLMDVKGIGKIYASFFTGNEASRRIMEKCGMCFDHFSPKELTYHGIERDLTYYALSSKGDALLLNGPSSAGKSTIAKALKKRFDEKDIDSVIVSLDDYLEMSEDEPIFEDDVYECVGAMHEKIAEALSEGRKVIIDHVITSPRIYESLCDAAKGYRMKKILVTCDDEVLCKRERERGNRCIGSAAASKQYLYPKDGYDLIVDTGKDDPESNADRIIKDLYER